MLVSILAVGIFYHIMLPTIRSHQFAQAVRSGKFDSAWNMLPGDTAGSPCVFFTNTNTIRIDPVTALNLWDGTRKVVFFDFENYRYGEFIITCNRDSSSASLEPIDGFPRIDHLLNIDKLVE